MTKKKEEIYNHYLVSYFDKDDNSWVIRSYHKNKEHAVINAEVAHQSKQCPVRVIYEGKIVYQASVGLIREGNQ